MALLQPFCNLTNFYFSISPNEYYNNLIEEQYGCIKHVGMTYDMFMRMPIQDRRAFIRRHNAEIAEENKNMDAIANGGGKNNTSFEGEAINAYAKLEQGNRKGGH